MVEYPFFSVQSSYEPLISPYTTLHFFQLNLLYLYRNGLRNKNKMGHYLRVWKKTAYAKIDSAVILAQSNILILVFIKKKFPYLMFIKKMLIIPNSPYTKKISMYNFVHKTRQNFSTYLVKQTLLVFSSSPQNIIFKSDVILNLLHTNDLVLYTKEIPISTNFVLIRRQNLSSRTVFYVFMKISPIEYTERLFVRINRKSESYFSIISFQSEANRVYVSEINIVVFKRRN